MYGHKIELCNCGSMKCRGKMLGFQAEKNSCLDIGHVPRFSRLLMNVVLCHSSGLPLQSKVELLEIVDREIRDKFFHDKNDILMMVLILKRHTDLRFASQCSSIVQSSFSLMM